MLSAATSDERKAIAQEIFGERDNIELLSTYFELYDTLTSPQARHSIIEVREPVFKNHNDLLNLIRELKKNYQSTRAEFKARTRSSTEQLVVDDSEIDYAVNIAIHLMFMIDCNLTDSHSAGYNIDGYKPARWRSHDQFKNFVTGGFPLEHSPDRIGIQEAQLSSNMIKGWKLRKRAHVTFLPSDDLREHLLYDPQTNVVRLFRHTAFLKAQLKRSGTLSLDCSMEDCLQLGTLPPQLLLETLHSLQYILFPSFDEKSFRLLESLTRGKGPTLDPDCLSYDTLIREMPFDFEYRYWGSRLARLHQLVRNPKPQSRLEQWVERHTSERNALYTALLGLFLAVLFGFLGVIIGIIQTWIAYKAWKDPQQPAQN